MTPNELTRSFTDLYFAALYLLMLSEPIGLAHSSVPACLLRDIRTAATPGRHQRPNSARRHLYMHLRAQVEALFGSASALNHHFERRSQWMPAVETWIRNGAKQRIDTFLAVTSVPITTRTAIEAALTPQMHDLLATFPERAEDVLDAFLMSRVHELAVASQGKGFLAVNANDQLKAMINMSYADLRNQARKSMRFPAFVKAYGPSFQN